MLESINLYEPVKRELIFGLIRFTKTMLISNIKISEQISIPRQRRNVIKLFRGFTDYKK